MVRSAQVVKLVQIAKGKTVQLGEETKPMQNRLTKCYNSYKVYNVNNTEQETVCRMKH